MSFPSSPSQQVRSQTEDLIPKKQQWALINQYKAIEFQRMKQMQKYMDIQKKRRFKEQLDNQLQSKSGNHAQQKQADRRYYEFITRRAQEMKEKQQRQKMNKIIQRKMVEEENQHNLDGMRNSRGKDYDTGYHLDIGVKSEIQRRNMGEYYKKQMLDTLDKQLQIKAQERRKEKINSLETDQANLKYQYEQFDRRKFQGRRFGQNQNVYQYYKNLDEQKRYKQMQLEHKLVDQAALKKMEQEDRKKYMKQRQKYLLTNQMKNTLDLQIDIHQKKHQMQKKVNPEEHTYSVIGNMFKQRQSPYNKQEYSQFLRRQAQEAAQKKKKQSYMTQEQYRINMNQLNRAVSGNYAHQKYIDRSVGAIGDNKKINLTQMSDKVQDQDSEVVKARLENLKARTRRFGINDSSMY